MAQPCLETDSTLVQIGVVATDYDQETKIVLGSTNDERSLEPCETSDFCDGDSEFSEYSENGFNEVALPTPDFSGGITATVQNSSGVTIAQNLNHINGPVTIYYPSNYQDGANGVPGITVGERNADGIVNKEAFNVANDTKNVQIDIGPSKSLPNTPDTKSTRKKIFSHFGSISKTAAAILVLILTLTIAIAVYYSFFQQNYATPTAAPDPDHEADDLGEDIYFITRSEWNARSPRNTTYFSDTPSLVIVRHTGGGMCTDFRSCTSKMVALQSLFVAENKMDDIAYHFVIGGDGNVYEGRGWDIRGHYSANTIEVCYTGNFVDGFDQPTEKMIEAGRLLLKKGLELNKLTQDYRVVAHNQTWNTQSPGENIYREIKKWPHYYGGLITKGL